ncbi:hypothetical protein PV341_34830 [Streptomyces sp. PA03-1a]|nr:hypothetical protein [Streptomyces sp. PA03-1a]MDX2814974.1 hypothetical protein [Streptomyces sp. PA03-5A]
MANHSIDEVYSRVADIKGKLETGGGVATQAYIDGKFKEQKGGGLTKEYLDQKFKDAKEEPTQAENWAKAIGFGLDEVVKGLQDFKADSVAAWSALAAIVGGFAVSTLFDADKVKASLLGKARIEHDENGIPRRKKDAEPAVRAPVESIDVERVKSMRSASIALSRSLSDLTKELNGAARQMA